MLSPSQLKRYWLELRAVQSALAMRNDRCSMLNAQSSGDSSPTQSSALGPQSFREQFHARNGLPASTKSFTQKDFDTFLAACRAITQPSNLKPQLRAFDQPKTRLLNKILIGQAAQLRALEIANPSEYIAQICFDKFQGRLPSQLVGPAVPSGPSSPDSPTRSSVLSPQPSELSAPSAPPRENYSDLEKLLFTVSRTISELRQKRGWTVHELLWQSNLLDTCMCADCRKARHPIRAPQALECGGSTPLSLSHATAEPNPF